MQTVSEEEMFPHDDDEWKNQFQKKPDLYPYKKYDFILFFY